MADKDGTIKDLAGYWLAFRRVGRRFTPVCSARLVRNSSNKSACAS